MEVFSEDEYDRLSRLMPLEVLTIERAAGIVIHYCPPTRNPPPLREGDAMTFRNYWP